jgi:hypothetical protein
MSFTVDFGNIRETDKEGKKNLNGLQYWIGSYMMAIGMDEITEKTISKSIQDCECWTLLYLPLAIMEMESLG